MATRREVAAIRRKAEEMADIQSSRNVHVARRGPTQLVREAKERAKLVLYEAMVLGVEQIKARLTKKTLDPLDALPALTDAISVTDPTPKETQAQQQAQAVIIQIESTGKEATS